MNLGYEKRDVRGVVGYVVAYVHALKFEWETFNGTIFRVNREVFIG